MDFEAIQGNINQTMRMSDILQKAIEEKSRSPVNRKGAGLYRIKDAADLVGRDRSSLMLAEQAGIVPTPPRKESSGHRVGYPLSSINAFRQHFKTSPHRKGDEETIVTAVINFKGGVAKSATTISLSHYLARMGYRVLIIDMDTQATATSSFGYIPDLNDDVLGIDPSDTLLPYFSEGDVDSIRYAVRSTNWDQLDLIPSCLEMNNLEFNLYQQVMDSLSRGEDPYHEYLSLKNAIDTVKDDYDIVLIDSPPSLGVFSLNIMLAANSFVIPCPPRIHDVSSTIQFLKTFDELFKRYKDGSIHEELHDVKFLKVLQTMRISQRRGQANLIKVMPQIFGELLCESYIPQSADIENAYAEFMSPYEYNKCSKETLSILDAFGEEYLRNVHAAWGRDENESATKVRR